MNRQRTDRDAKNARNENRNEMNAKSEFALGAEQRWRHPEPNSPRKEGQNKQNDLTGHVGFKLVGERRGNFFVELVHSIVIIYLNKAE